MIWLVDFWVSGESVCSLAVLLLVPSSLAASLCSAALGGVPCTLS